jgi:3',5'-nucleoside bisphosphate phosphatase
LRVDLHIHSTASDGSLPPAAVVNAARAGGLDVIALADHDTIGGIAAARSAAGEGIHVIAGLELSTRHADAELHMLGYYVDPAEPVLAAFLVRAATRREDRVREMIDRLAGMGVHIAWEDVLAAAGPRPDSIGRPHLARAVVVKGYAAAVGDVFDRYIGDHGPAFVPHALITPLDAIDLIHRAGGVAVWAHPRVDELATGLRPLADGGLDGVECYRPRTLPAEAERIARHATAHGLFITGGSDWHGDWHGPLGAFAVSSDDIAEFLSIGGI